jgi:hypothetical protein
MEPVRRDEGSIAAARRDRSKTSTNASLRSPASRGDRRAGRTIAALLARIAEVRPGRRDGVVRGSRRSRPDAGEASTSASRIGQADRASYVAAGFDDGRDADQSVMNPGRGFVAGRQLRPDQVGRGVAVDSRLRPVARARPRRNLTAEGARTPMPKASSRPMSRSWTSPRAPRSARRDSSWRERSSGRHGRQTLRSLAQISCADGRSVGLSFGPHPRLERVAVAEPAPLGCDPAVRRPSHDHA